MQQMTETVRLLNVDRFRKQLANPELLDEKRKLIVKLLAEEEAKASPLTPPSY